MPQHAGAKRRDIGDAMWQIAEKGGCDEIVVRYDCGHALRADIWSPVIPKIREYGSSDAERRRFTRHGVFVLTRDPGATSLQITIPEGRCRHCGRGLRQTLVCGLLQMSLADAAIATRRLELPMSAHAFLAAMGQACGLPENTPPPSLTPRVGGSLKIFDCAPLPREGLRQWTRKEVEDALGRDIVKYICAATIVLLASVMGVVLCAVALLDPSSRLKAEALRGNATHAGDLDEMTAEAAGFMWNPVVAMRDVLSSLGLGPRDGSALPWSSLLNPLWMARSLGHASVWLVVHVAQLTMTVTSAVVNGVIVQPTIVLSQLPVTNPMIVASVLSVLVAAFSAPQPSNISLSGVWADLPSLEMAQALRRAVSRSKTFEALVQRRRDFPARKEGRGAKAGAKCSAARSPDAGRPERAQAKAEGRGAQGPASVPPCFVCLDRPSRYVLEPCGHRVVCGECAVQLVEAAARRRSVDAGGAHHASERGGACPSCSRAITRATRLLS